jgi:hypothetical protein
VGVDPDLKPKPRAKRGRARAAAAGPVPVAPVVTTPAMSLDEMKEILKTIAREGSNAAARIAAVKELRAIQAGEKPSGAFADLDELAPRRQGLQVKK